MITIQQLAPIVIDELEKFPFELNSRKGMNVTVENFRIKTRKREFVEVRQFCSLFLKNYTRLSLAEIGEKIGGFDHGTVMSLIKKISGFMETDHRIIEIYNNIDSRVKDFIAIMSSKTLSESFEYYKGKAIDKDLERFVFKHQGFCFISRVENYVWIDPEIIEML